MAHAARGVGGRVRTGSPGTTSSEMQRLREEIDKKTAKPGAPPSRN